MCIVGISLPLWATYARELFVKLRFWPSSHAFESGVSSVLDNFGQCDSSLPHRSSSAQCPLFQSPHPPEFEFRSDGDEFVRQSKIAIRSFRTAFLSVYGALIAMDPLTLLPNLSWFCLGKSIIHWIIPLCISKGRRLRISYFPIISHSGKTLLDIRGRVHIVWIMFTVSRQGWLVQVICGTRFGKWCADCLLLLVVSCHAWTFTIEGMCCSTGILGSCLR